MFMSECFYISLECTTLLPPGDGKVQQGFSESDQLLTIYTCDKGFALTGNKILTCVKGVWDKIPPLCVCKCMNQIVIRIRINLSTVYS